MDTLSLGNGRCLVIHVFYWSLHDSGISQRDQHQWQLWLEKYWHKFPIYKVFWPIRVNLFSALGSFGEEGRAIHFPTALVVHLVHVNLTLTSIILPTNQQHFQHFILTIAYWDTRARINKSIQDNIIIDNMLTGAGRGTTLFFSTSMVSAFRMSYLPILRNIFRANTILMHQKKYTYASSSLSPL